MNSFKSHEQLFEKLQARFKGKKAREAYLKRMEDFKTKEKEIVVLQAFWRGARTRQQYQDLVLKKGKANVGVVAKFLHLLDTRDDEFDEERVMEDLRGKVIQQIRENISAEIQLNDLDAKVALLVKNRISVQEVSHFKSKDMRAALAKSAIALEKESGVLTLRGNDKDVKEKRKKYEELFYILQTQPKYLSALMFIVNKTSGGSATKFLEQVVLTLYGYAQNSREEFLFLHLMEECIRVEVSDAARADEALKDNPLFVKLVLQYTRGAKEREYLRGLLRPLLESIMADDTLDLDTDPISIYKGCIRDEEATTGEKSNRPYEATKEAALEDAQVNTIYLSNLEKLKKLTDSFLVSIVKSVDKMPYGIRFIAMKMKEALKAKFPGAEQEKEINQVIGNLLYYRYINPVIVSPEAFDVIESVVAPAQRKNFAEVAKTLHQISVDRTSKHDESFSNYLKTASTKFSKFLEDASSVVSSEEYFGLNEFLDTGKKETLNFYVTPDEVVQVHHSLVDNLSHIPTLANDPLRVLLTEMGNPPVLGTAAKGAGSEVVLRLSNRFVKAADDESVVNRNLLKDAKRLVLLIIRFSTGKSLLDILEKVATAAQEVEFMKYVIEAEKGRQAVATSLENLTLIDAARPIYKASDDS